MVNSVSDDAPPPPDEDLLDDDEAPPPADISIDLQPGQDIDLDTVSWATQVFYLRNAFAWCFCFNSSLPVRCLLQATMIVAAALETQQQVTEQLEALME